MIEPNLKRKDLGVIRLGPQKKAKSSDVGENPDGESGVNKIENVLKHSQIANGVQSSGEMPPGDKHVTPIK